MNARKTHLTITLAATIGAAAGIAGYAQAASSNPFAMQSLNSGYLVSAAETKAKEGKCGEGKCGGDKAKSTAESTAKSAAKAKEGKCGEGKCGGSKTKAKEGKCGEGKCGGKN